MQPFELLIQWLNAYQNHGINVHTFKNAMALSKTNPRSETYKELGFCHYFIQQIILNQCTESTGQKLMAIYQSHIILIKQETIRTMITTTAALPIAFQHK